MFVRTLTVLVGLGLLAGCDDKASPSTSNSATVSATAPKASAKPAPSPSAAAMPSATAAAPSAAAAPSGKITQAAMAKFQPPVPSEAGADFEWALRSTAGTTIGWNLVKKGDTKKRAVLEVEISDETDDVKSGSVAKEKTDKYKTTYPSEKGVDFLRAWFGNVEVQVSIGRADSGKVGALDPKLGTMAMVTKLMDSIDAAGLSKL